MAGLTDEILHYSQSAAPHRLKMKRCYPDRYAKFKDTVDLSGIKQTAERVLAEAELGPDEPKKTLDRLQSGSGFTKSRKQLMFTYKCQLEKILEDGQELICQHTSKSPSV